MTLWLLFAVMTAIAIAAVLWPLSRRPKGAAGGNDVAVYRDQLDEIERDRALGAIAGPEAEAARIEVSRRLIAAADTSAAERAATSSLEPVWRRRAVALVTLLAVPLGAASLYLALGSPDLPDQPLAERLAKVHAGVPMTPGGQNQGQSVEALVARVEAYLEKNPEDGRGWEVIAPVYMRTGNYEAAAKARANALRLLGPTADREADHAEALVAAADGVVTAEAKAAFERAIKLDRENVSARFYLGLAAEQEGRKADAIAAWRALLADAPPDATWTDFVRRSIARARRQGHDRGEAGRSPAASPRAHHGRHRQGARDAFSTGSGSAGSCRAGQFTSSCATGTRCRRTTGRHDPWHGRPPRRAAEAGRIGRRGLAAPGALLCRPGRRRQGPRRRRRRPAGARR